MSRLPYALTSKTQVIDTNYSKSILLVLMLIAIAIVAINVNGIACSGGIAYVQQDQPQFSKGVMRPDAETIKKWMTFHEKAPLAYISPQIGIMIQQAPGMRFSLLDRSEYDPETRNQGSCGNCWVWAGTSVLQIALDVQEGIRIPLSVQHPTSCWPGTLDRSWACCGGWLSELATWYQQTGFAISSTYSSNAEWADGSRQCADGGSSITCESILTSPKWPIKTVAATKITTHGIGQAKAIANIKNVLHQNKAIWLAYFLANASDWNNFYTFWDNGNENVIWNPNFSCGHTWDPAQGGAHAVLIVGYDDTDPQNPYWIALNSWGTTPGRPHGIFHIDMRMDYDCNFILDGTSYRSFLWETLDVSFDIPAGFAVTDPSYDNIGSILTIMGHKFEEVQDPWLADYNLIKKYNAIFINCSWDSAANAPAARDSLERYVREGGALYASDWAFIYLKEAFPGYLFFPANPYIGVGNQHVTATITDLGLQLYLMQKSVDIFYNLGAWAVMTDVGPGTEVIMRGDVQVWTGTETREPEPIYQGGGAKSLQYLSPPVTAQGIETWTDKPLAASFEYGDGFVIYTTFHNEPQLTELQQKLLEYFIIKPITAKIAKWLGDKLDSLNYLIKQKIINIINKGAKKTFSYVVDKIKDIIIALGFEGSRFRVSVYRPDGSLYTQVESETSPIIIEIPGAEPGEWTFTVEALDVPYDNYPIVILIGEAGGKLLTASQKALDLIEKADQEKLQVFKGLATFYDALSELETEVGSLIIDIEQNMLDGNIAQSLADPLTKLVDEDGRPKAPLLVISALLSYKDMDLIEMDKLLEQADEYESEALAQLSIVATTCGGNADCEQNAAKKALEALDQSIKLMKEAEKHIWGIKDEIKAILAWICGFQQLVTRASSADITSDYRAELLSRARDLIDLTMDLLEVLREGIFTAMVKVKDLKLEARATIESILKFSAASSSSAASSLGVPNLWAYADRSTIHFMALSSTVRSLRVQVFNLAGKEIFDSGLVLGNQLSWQPQAVANGAYLYVILACGFDEAVRQSEVWKLIILR